jgi:hypothetical protein
MAGQDSDNTPIPGNSEFSADQEQAQRQTQVVNAALDLAPPALPVPKLTNVPEPSDLTRGRSGATNPMV